MLDEVHNLPGREGVLRVRADECVGDLAVRAGCTGVVPKRRQAASMRQKVTNSDASAVGKLRQPTMDWRIEVEPTSVGKM